jgi:hypothetical protein
LACGRIGCGGWRRRGLRHQNLGRWRSRATKARAAELVSKIIVEVIEVRHVWTSTTPRSAPGVSRLSLVAWVGGTV